MSKVFVDAYWFNQNSGIGRFAFENLSRFNVVNWEKIGTPLGSTFLSIAYHPVRLALCLSTKSASAFWSPGYVPAIHTSISQFVTIHDLNHLYCYSGLHASYVRNVLFPLWRRCEGIITVSQYTKSRIVAELGAEFDQRISVAYNGVSSVFTSGSRVEVSRPYFIYVGNRRPYKNIERMLIAFSKISASRDMQFHLTGDSNPSIMALIASLAISDKVVFLGSVTEAQLSFYYRNALACVFVSLHEGFGLPPLESMACGTPVIVSNCSSMPEVCGVFARYVDPYDVGSITEGMVDVVVNNTKWRNKIANCADWLSQFSWDKSSRVIENVISC